jgi:hypothetical protein
MLKVSLILIAGVACLFYFTNVQASKDYWKNVGPTWDRALNPLKYETGEGNG